MSSDSFFSHIDECLASAIKDAGQIAERVQRSKALAEIERIAGTRDPRQVAQRADAVVCHAVDGATTIGRALKAGATRCAIDRFLDLFKRKGGAL